MTPGEYKELSDRLAKVEEKLDPSSESYVLKPLLPYMQGAAGLGLLWKGLAAVGGLIILYLQIKQYFNH